MSTNKAEQMAEIMTARRSMIAAQQKSQIFEERSLSLRRNAPVWNYILHRALQRQWSMTTA